nr:MAG TPA: Ascorbate peroxidase [Bacteriophage sp.]
MDNKMSSVADLLGMELGEVFRIKDYPTYPETYFRFTDDGLMQSVDTIAWTKPSAWVLGSLITGALQITKLPWKPSYGEVFYMPSVVNENKYIRLFWHDSGTYKSFYQQGMICRTKEEAVKLAEEMLDIARKRFAGDIR